MANFAVLIALGAALVALVPVLVITSRAAAMDKARKKKRDGGPSATYTSSTGPGTANHPTATVAGVRAVDGDGEGGGGD